MHDALCVLIATVKNNKVIYGGGNSEITMSNAIYDESKKIKGK
jgi:T-complex protein 1 subunit beta